MTFSRADVLEMLRLHDAYESSSGAEGQPLDFGDEDADLTDLDLSGRSFVETVFGRQDLSGADLRGCDLHRANFFEADLSKARLDRADLSKAKLDGVRAPYASFDLADLTSATFYHADLNSASFRRAWLQLTEYNDADLRGANFRESGFDGTSFYKVLVDHTDASGTTGTVDAGDSWVETDGGREPLGSGAFVDWLINCGAQDVRAFEVKGAGKYPESPGWRWRP